MAEERVKVTVSYAGKEKRIPLAVTPALELSDEQVEYAEGDLLRIVRHVFQIPAGARVYLHETESGRIMSPESFRDPANLVAFPRHWYLAVEHAPPSYPEERPRPPSPHHNGPLEDLSELLVSSGQGSPDEAELLPSLADLSPPDTHYQRATVTANQLGQFGITLRHFSIQPDNLPGSSDGPDPADTFSLSSTFIQSVHPSGPASDSGLKEGDVVHMINNVSVITSGLEEMQDLLDQCGEELALLVLPKERDDLQFLYPKYTNGEAGERATVDGHVCVCDLTLHKGQLPEDKLWSKKMTLSPENPAETKLTPKLLASSPPMGLVPFSGSSNSLSCSNENMVVHQSSADDILISGALSEIPIATSGSPFKAEFGEGELSWGVPGATSNGSPRMPEDYNPKLSPTWQILFPSAVQNGETQFPPEPMEGAAWYQESEDSFAEYSVPSLLAQESTRPEELYSSVSDTRFNSRPHKKAARTRSHSSIEGRGTLPRQLGATPPSLRGRAALTSSTSALDRLPLDHASVSLSQPSPGHCKSTDLGAVRLKKKGRKSLEALTRITVAKEGLKRHRSDSTTHRIMPLSQPEPDTWAMESPASKHTPSDTSQHSGSQPHPQQQSERLVPEEPRVSVEPARSESFKGKRQGKSYRSQREQLHKHKSSKGSLVETGAPGLRPRKKPPSREGGRGRGWTQAPEEGAAEPRENRQLELLPNRLDKRSPEAPNRLDKRSPEAPNRLDKRSPEAPKIVIAPQDPGAVPVRREHKSPPQRRPVSAAEPSHAEKPLSRPDPRSSTLDGSGRQHRFTHSVEVPLQTESSRRIPIYHTRSAHTPYGQEIIREVPIDEAIRLSAQGGTQGERSFSVDSGVASGDFMPQRFGKPSRNANELDVLQSKHSLAASDERLYPRRSPTPERRTSAELISAPSPISIPLLKASVVCHGLLSKKLDRDESGKRSQNRSWRQFYVVLSAGKLFFYKDMKDAVLNKPCDEPPLEVVPSSTEMATNYSKKKFVFRVSTAQGSEYLLQAEDHEHMRLWVGHIQKLNGGKPAELAVAQLRDGGSKLAPSSPRLSRRASSPPPVRAAKKKEEGGGLLDRLKKSLSRSKDEPDSCFVSFGQLLSDCPVSPENKRVPLVVEFCVKEMEEHGLEVEGIYRKPGMAASTRAMSAAIDKGVYSFEDDEDIHIIGSLLKKFLKELPDAVIPANMYEDFVACGREEDEQHRLQRLKDLVYALPTAHYHTLKYLMTHLQKITAHSEDNKMTLKNVSLVFGPTLVRNPNPPAGLIVNDINAGNAVVEMLCQHVEFLFGPALCAEEVQEQQALLDQAEPEPEPLGAHRHRTASEPAIHDHRVQKVEALAKASPLMVRRIRNDLSSRSATPEGKHGPSSVAESSVPLQPKQLNWDSQKLETLKSNNSSGSSIPSPAAHSPEPPVGGAPHHSYSRRVLSRTGEVPAEREHRRPRTGEVPAEREHRRGEDTSRTRSWVDHHSDLGWGRERKRLAKTRDQLLTSYPPPGEPVRELLTTSHGSQGRNDSPTRFTALPPSENRMGNSHSMQSRVRGSTLPTPTRRVSYATAISEYGHEAAQSQDLPVHQGRSRHSDHYYRHQPPEPGDSRQFESSYPQSHASSYRRHSENLHVESGGKETMTRASGLPVYNFLQRSNSGRYHHHSPEGPDRLLPSNSSYSAQLESYL